MVAITFMDKQQFASILAIDHKSAISTPPAHFKLSHLAVNFKFAPCVQSKFIGRCNKRASFHLVPVANETESLEGRTIKMIVTQ